MVEDRHEPSSLLPYLIAAFILIQIWGFMSYETAQFQLLAAYETPLVWVFWGCIMLLVLAPISAILVWKMKNRVAVENLSWEFRDREVVLDEFKQLVREYTSNYRHFISYWDWRLILSTFTSAALALIVPFLLIRTNWIGILVAPFAFGALVIVFGLLLMVTLYGGLKNAVSSEFPVPRARRVSQEASVLSRIAGISWHGARITIGESQGFYTMRNARGVGHIEGIEGVAWLEGATSEDLPHTHAIAVLENSKGSREMVGKPSAFSDSLGLTLLVRGLLEEYCKERGENELLEDVIEEVEDSVKHLKGLATSK